MGKKIRVQNVEATQRLSEQLAQYLLPGDVLLLDGDLGAGKTTFTQGLARGLGIKKRVKSPTFTIIREYQEGRLPLYHMDAYRLEESGAGDMGLEEYFEGDGVSVIEWGTFLKEALPQEFLKIKIEKLKDDFEREFIFQAQGTRYQQLLEQLEEQLNE